MLIENEVSPTRSVSQWKLNRDRDQISQEIQLLIRYYKEDFVSKEKSFVNTRCRNHVNEVKVVLSYQYKKI